MFLLFAILLTFYWHSESSCFLLFYWHLTDTVRVLAFGYFTQWARATPHRTVCAEELWLILDLIYIYIYPGLLERTSVELVTQSVCQCWMGVWSTRPLPELRARASIAYHHFNSIAWQPSHFFQANVVICETVKISFGLGQQWGGGGFF